MCMYRATILVLALLFPSVAAAQQPCTTDARHVVNELYRHMLERQADAGSAHWVQQLENGRMTVREVVRAVAVSPEYTQRFWYAESGEGTPYERSVGRLYRHLLGRQPDAEGQNAFARMGQQSGINPVVDRILTSSEYRQQFGDWGVPGSGGLRYCRPNGVDNNNDQASVTPGWRFRDMDRNGDGVITRNEWRSASGSMPSFNRLDVNNDSRLTRYEFRGRADEDRFGRADQDQFGVAPTAGESVVVDAQNEWTDSGLRVRAGDLMLFDATGTARLSGERGDIATAAGARSGRRAPDAPLSNQPAGALIGRIDNGQPFLIGNRRSIRANSTGHLYLGVNDDYWEDNTGSFQVMVSVE
jgi:phycobilisome linker polypeptide/uncharacterized protein DUF4214/EF hand domain-containing protein